jgi:hypothetical protein
MERIKEIWDRFFKLANLTESQTQWAQRLGLGFSVLGSSSLAFSALTRSLSFENTTDNDVEVWVSNVNLFGVGLTKPSINPGSSSNQSNQIAI